MAAERTEKIRTALRLLAAIAFVGAGANHFLNPAPYLGIIPPQLPRPDLLNWISGAAEIAGGVGLLIPQLRRAAAIGLLLLLVAVFPANIYAALRGSMPGVELSPLALWIRLPFQLVFLAWVWWVGLASSNRK